MLSEIHITNFALIDDLNLQLGEGFNILTGETGAGKSIIIDAVTTILGERASADLIRTGADRARIEAVFNVSGSPEAREKAVELGIDAEDGLLLIAREVAAGGKSQTRINGRLCTLSMLRELTSGLIDIHGQHEHQSLLSVDSHLDILDQWCGQAAVDLRARVGELYARQRSLVSELERLRSDERERVRLLDLYEFQKSEIEATKLAPGEEEELLAERSRLANAEKLCELASEVHAAISGAGREAGATDTLSSALAQLRSMASLDDSLAPVLEDLETALYAAEQAGAAIRSYRDDIEFNPGRLESVEERLDLIRTLKRKYGDTIEDIIAYGESMSRKLHELAHSEERTAELVEEIRQVEDEFIGAARRLSDMRKEGAVRFASSVEAELAELAMEDTKFGVSFSGSEAAERGIDQVEFVISPNPGEPLKPLAKIASGGEMSRIMLALKTVMADAHRVPTLIFDEIDTGIGGRTAQVLGQKLASVARGAQVICVTHLPLIASQADWHFVVEKRAAGDRTVVRVHRVEGDERVEELARMLGGAEDSQTAAEHARELLAEGHGAWVVGPGGSVNGGD